MELSEFIPAKSKYDPKLGGNPGVFASSDLDSGINDTLFSPITDGPPPSYDQVHQSEVDYMGSEGEEVLLNDWVEEECDEEVRNITGPLTDDDLSPSVEEKLPPQEEGTQKGAKAPVVCDNKKPPSGKAVEEGAQSPSSNSKESMSSPKHRTGAPPPCNKKHSRQSSGNTDLLSLPQTPEGVQQYEGEEVTFWDPETNIKENGDQRHENDDNEVVAKCSENSPKTQVEIDMDESPAVEAADSHPEDQGQSSNNSPLGSHNNDSQTMDCRAKAAPQPPKASALPTAGGAAESTVVYAGEDCVWLVQFVLKEPLTLSLVSNS